MGLKLKIAIWFIRLRVNRTLSRRNPRRLQNRYFHRLLRQLSRAPFYQPFLKNGVSITDLPVINKKIFVEQFDTINTVGLRNDEALQTALKAEESRNFLPTVRGVTVGLSTGTSGNRAVFLASEEDRARWVAAILDRVTGISLKKRKIAFFLRANSNLYASVQSRIMQFHFFDLLAPLTENIKRLQALQPDLLVAQPSMLAEIAKCMEMGRLTITPRKVISVAEVLTPEDSRHLSEVFRQTIHQVYQCAEGFLAFSCKHGTLHFNEDFVYVEKKFIDPDSKRFHPVITDLLRTAQPVIRYELDDIVVEKLSCPCGSSLTGIERIEGRSDDIMIFRKQNGEEIKIFPDFFRKAIVLSHPSITDYVLTQTASTKLQLYIWPDEPLLFEKAVESLQKLIASYGISNVGIEKTNERGFQRGTKFRRIRNEQTRKDHRTG